MAAGDSGTETGGRLVGPLHAAWCAGERERNVDVNVGGAEAAVWQYGPIALSAGVRVCPGGWLAGAALWLWSTHELLAVRELRRGC